MLIVPKAVVVQVLASVLCHSFRNVVQLINAFGPKLTDDDPQPLSEASIIFWRLIRSDWRIAKL